MDDGYVIPCLNEEWTLLGAKLSEWGAGMVMFMVVAEGFQLNISRSMPLLLGISLITILSLAAFRKKFPDEERGVRNSVCCAIGIPPQGIPAPALMQPVWSGAPLRELPEKCEYRELELDLLFEKQEE